MTQSQFEHRHRDTTRVQIEMTSNEYFLGHFSSFVLEWPQRGKMSQITRYSNELEPTCHFHPDNGASVASDD